MSPRKSSASSESSESSVSIPALSALPTIPAGWEAKAAMVDQCIGAGKRLKLWIAMLVAEGREDFDDPSEWIRACTDRWGWDKAFLHHMTAVGRLLLSPMAGVQHAALCELEFEKVASISRLPPNLLGPFLEKAMPIHLNRDEVRAAVNRWLKAAGEPVDDAAPTPARRQLSAAPVQVDFLEALFAASAEDPHAFARRVQERAVACDNALPVLNRALTVLDAMIGRLDRRHPEAFAVLAKTLRNEATRLEKLIADPGILSPVRPLSPPPGLASPEDAVRRRLPVASKEE